LQPTYLKPLVKNPKKFNFSVCDIESTNWIKFSIIGYYDGKNYQRFEKLSEFIQSLVKIANSKKSARPCVFAHYGGTFDFNFIIEELHNQGMRYSLITIGAKIIQIKVFLSNKRTILFRDSSCILQGKLEKLANSFETAHRKQIGSIDFEKEQFDKTNKKHLEYAKYDCFALYEVLEKYFSHEMIQSTGFGVTTASQAMLIFRRKFLKFPVTVTTQEIQDFCREGYYGGRVEIFKTSGKNLKLYDVNSLYPFSMKNILPVEYYAPSRNFEVFGYHDVTVHAPEMYIPILPVKMNGKLCFPCGEFRGVFFSEELKLAVKHGYKILAHHRGERFLEYKGFFDDYVDYWYSERLKNKKGSPQEYIAKLCLNSLYGKFGQREENVSLSTEAPTTGAITRWGNDERFELTGLYEIETFKRSPFQLVNIAAAVTSYARIHMVKNYYLPYQDSLYYTDTDSVFTNEELHNGKNLGEMKLEKENLSGKFRLPKCYATKCQVTKEEEIKVKGFPKQELKGINFDNFDKINFSFENTRFSTFRSSILRNKKYLSMVNTSRKIKSVYDKRRILPNGNTEPWIIKKGEKENGI